MGDIKHTDRFWILSTMFTLMFTLRKKNFRTDRLFKSIETNQYFDLPVALADCFLPSDQVPEHALLRSSSSLVDYRS